MSRISSRLLPSALVIAGVACGWAPLAAAAETDDKGASAPTSPAANGPGHATAEFGTLDTNANQLIDRTEAKALQGLEQDFDQLDENHDGQLSESEFSGFEREGPKVSDSRVKAVQESAKPAQPQESWFEAPEHKPRPEDDPSRGRESR